jgi:hypothetical protein
MRNIVLGHFIQFSRIPIDPILINNLPKALIIALQGGFFPTTQLPQLLPKQPIPLLIPLNKMLCEILNRHGPLHKLRIRHKEIVFHVVFVGLQFGFRKAFFAMLSRQLNYEAVGEEAAVNRHEVGLVAWAAF